MVEPEDSAIAKVRMGEVAVAILRSADGKRRVIGPRPPGFIGWLLSKLRSGS